jgi:hypothetical protein
MKLNRIFSIIPGLRGLSTIRLWLGVGRVATTVYMMALDPLIGIPQQAATSGCGAPSPWNFDSTHPSHSNQTIHDRSFYVRLTIPMSLMRSCSVSTDSRRMTFTRKRSPGFHRVVWRSMAGCVLSWGFEHIHTFYITKGIVGAYPFGAWSPGKKDGDPPARAWQGAPYTKVSTSALIHSSRNCCNSLV